MIAGRLKLTTVVALACLVALSGCGRKGSLQPPGTTDEPATLDTVLGTSAPQPATVAPPEPVRDRPFILDAII